MDQLFSQNRPVYLDFNSTTPPIPELLHKIPSFLEAWANPSSIHQFGRNPKTLLRESRQKLAQFLNLDPLEIIFTASGSESNNLAIKGVYFNEFELNSKKPEFRNQIIISSVEHPSLIKAAMSLKTFGAHIDLIPVKKTGEIDLEVYQQLLSEKTLLVSVMAVNNETGNIFPIKKMSKMAHEKGALFHVDAVQALGKMRFHFRDWDVDLGSLAAHKFYSLRGAGILYSKRGTKFTSLIHGGGQERARRGGTENILAIAAFAEMTTYKEQIFEKAEQMKDLRDLLETLILQNIREVKITGIESERVCNTSSLVIEGVDSESMLMSLDIKGFAVSSGAACSSGSTEPSHVLLAMGLSREEAQSSLRISVGWTTTKEEIQVFVHTLKEIVQRLRQLKEDEKIKRIEKNQLIKEQEKSKEDSANV